MDADEALARMLQEEELREAQAAGVIGPGHGYGAAGAPDPAELEFEAIIQSTMATAMLCERADLQQRARAVMPLERLRREAAEAAAFLRGLGPDVEAAEPGGALVSEQDLLARSLLQWFKTSFFTWVNAPPCASCGATEGAMQHVGMAQPNAEDLRHGAELVEAYGCNQCRRVTRFPRYNDPGKLLEPGCRRGRCGEWANAFLLCCRAAGLTARYVRDWADHVWTEHWSHARKRWVHMDSCEASYDQPLLYEGGWGKEVSYVVAAGAWGAADVTPRYTAKWREVTSRRTLVPEAWLARTLDAVTTRRRAGWPQPKLLVWLVRDVAERRQLGRMRQGLMDEPTAGAALLPRQTGSDAWRASRGEDGVLAAAPSTSAAAAGSSAKPPTMFVPAGDLGLPPLVAAAGRVCGGACRASGQNASAEVVERLFDGSTSTKWLDVGGGGRGGSAWVEYRLPSAVPPVVLLSYDLVSANDCPQRDPAAWRLEGVTEEDFKTGQPDRWSLLDARSTTWPDAARHTLRTFALAAPSPPLRRVRLAISSTSNPDLADSVQLAAWNLYAAPAGADLAPDMASAPAAAAAAGLAGSTAAGGDSNSSGSAAADAAGAGPVPGSAAALGEAALQRFAAAVAAGEGGGHAEGGVAAGPLGVLRRVLANLQQQPGEPKYRKIRVSKLPAQLLQHPAPRDLLLQWLGFRPLAMPVADPPPAAAAPPGAAAAAMEARLRGGAGPGGSRGGGGGEAAGAGAGVPAGHDLFLVMDAEADVVCSRAGRALQALPKAAVLP